MPPALMLALCTGPVTTPSKSPARQPRPASSRQSTTKRALPGSAIATSSPGCSRCARRTQSSGPTPPGSPATRASRGGIKASGSADAGFHVGFGAQLAQEALVDLVGLALPDHLARLVTAVLVGDVLLADAQALDEVEAHVALEHR